MNISLIAAMSRNRVIGINNDLPWHLPDDLKYFMQTTKHHVVVMGRKNFESLPPKFSPLPNRTNVILTHQNNFVVDQCKVFNDIEEAYTFACTVGESEVFVIGGGQIYQLAIEKANQIYLTEIATDIENGEVFFPKMGNEWIEISRKHHPADKHHQYAFDFVRYKRKIG